MNTNACRSAQQPGPGALRSSLMTAAAPPAPGRAIRACSSDGPYGRAGCRAGPTGPRPWWPRGRARSAPRPPPPGEAVSASTRNCRLAPNRDWKGAYRSNERLATCPSTSCPPGAGTARNRPPWPGLAPAQRGEDRSTSWLIAPPTQAHVPHPPIRTAPGTAAEGRRGRPWTARPAQTSRRGSSHVATVLGCSCSINRAGCQPGMENRSA